MICLCYFLDIRITPLYIKTPLSEKGRKGYEIIFWDRDIGYGTRGRVGSATFVLGYVRTRGRVDLKDVWSQGREDLGTCGLGDVWTRGRVD